MQATRWVNVIPLRGVFTTSTLRWAAAFAECSGVGSGAIEIAQHNLVNAFRHHQVSHGVIEVHESVGFRINRKASGRWQWQLAGIRAHWQSEWIRFLAAGLDLRDDLTPSMTLRASNKVMSVLSSGFVFFQFLATRGNA